MSQTKPFFIPQKEFDLINQMNEELIDEIIGQSVDIYKVNVEMFNSPENFDDFQNWPIDQGAPWVDVDGDGEYNPLPSGVDHPKFYGDIVAFFVSADDEPGDKLAMNPATDPTEVEFQTTVFAFNSPSFSDCLLYTSPSPRDISGSRMPSSA